MREAALELDEIRERSVAILVEFVAMGLHRTPTKLGREWLRVRALEGLGMTTGGRRHPRETRSPVGVVGGFRDDFLVEVPSTRRPVW